MSGLEVTIKKKVSVKFPNITKYKDEDKHSKLCLMRSDNIADYDCDSIPCEECYFGLTVFTELSDVPTE